MKMGICRNTGLLLSGLFLTILVNTFISSAHAETIRYIYDNSQQVREVIYDDGTRVNYIYDTSGNRLSTNVSLFSSSLNNPPTQPTNIAPVDAVNDVGFIAQLVWTGSTDPDLEEIVSYDIYIGTSPVPPRIRTGQKTTNHLIQLKGLTTYYWKILSRDSHNAIAEGPTWSFTTTDDMDNDRVADADDNCPLNYNPQTDWTDLNNVIHIGEQSDYDLDGTGDACDHDLDGDGIDNNFPDNCPDMPNEWQTDTDRDGYGDVCDPDDDGDGVSDATDNCRLISNQDQSDIDEDGEGDSCDQDIDGDWSYNTNDNCLSVWNIQQKDMDNDGVGNVCDSDMDGDGIDNSADNCPFDPNTNQEDQDSDGFGDACTEVHCVSDAGQFQSVLSSAEGNNKNDIVRLVQGTYSVRDNGNYRFRHSSGEFYSIVIQAGYTAGCVSRALDPANTVLDGVINEDDSTRSNKVLDIGHSNNTVYPFWISIDDTIVKVEGVTVQNGQRGIEIYSFTGDITLQNNIIQNNGNNDWGGMRINGMEGTLMLLNNVIRNNTANYFAGAYLYTINGSIIIANNIVTGNNATVTNGGGIYAYIIGENGLIQIINNTLTGNKAYYNGGGIYLRMNEDSAVTDIYNNIIRGNTASAGEDIYIYGAGGSVNAFFNNIGMVDGQFRYSGSNINIDPEFIDDGYWDDNGTPSYVMDDIWYEGDYHLNTGSVSIDAGINTAPSLPFTDLDGEARLFDGDGDATVIADMGAYEYTDTDRDGIADYSDNCYVTFNPEQQDTDIDGYGNACDCDLDNNGFVGSNDYTIFGQAWWSDASRQNWNADADFDSDGFIGPNDFTIFGTRWWTSMPWQ